MMEWVMKRSSRRRRNIFREIFEFDFQPQVGPILEVPPEIFRGIRENSKAVNRERHSFLCSKRRLRRRRNTLSRPTSVTIFVF
jgi:hypothetical protein